MTERRSYIDPSHRLSIRRQADLLQVHRSGLYYKPVGESEQNLELMKQIDRLFLDDPTLGVIGMQDELEEIGFTAGEKRIRRLMRKMALMPICPKRNLSKCLHAQYVHPYLLRNRKITRANEAWAIDISYVPMRKGFMYLTAIIDLYSRFIVGWQVSNSLEKETQTELLTEAVRRYGKPTIINSDQGSQYTCAHWIDTLKEMKIRVSMDGKGRATDNAIIERWFRTVKQKHIYLNPARSGLELYEGIDTFVTKYNNRRHQGIGRRKPMELYGHAA